MARGSKNSQTRGVKTKITVLYKKILKIEARCSKLAFSPNSDEIKRMGSCYGNQTRVYFIRALYKHFSFDIKAIKVRLLSQSQCCNYSQFEAIWFMECPESLTDLTRQWKLFQRPATV